MLRYSMIALLYSSELNVIFKIKKHYILTFIKVGSYNLKLKSIISLNQYWHGNNYDTWCHIEIDQIVFKSDEIDNHKTEFNMSNDIAWCCNPLYCDYAIMWTHFQGIYLELEIIVLRLVC